MGCESTVLGTTLPRGAPEYKKQAHCSPLCTHLPRQEEGLHDVIILQHFS